MPEPDEPSGPRSRRIPGLPLLAAIIAVGMGIPAYLQWMVPRLEARRDRILAEAPTEPEGRLARWFEFGQPRIHEALVAARFSAARPWLVSHVQAPRDATEPPEIFGVDFADLDPAVIRRDGLLVRVVLPAPSLLARDVLVGDNAMGVPVYAPGNAPADPRALVKERLESVLSRVREGLEKDLPQARLSIEVGGLADPEPPRTIVTAPPGDEE